MPARSFNAERVDTLREGRCPDGWERCGRGVRVVSYSGCGGRSLGGSIARRTGTCGGAARHVVAVDVEQQADRLLRGLRDGRQTRDELRGGWRRPCLASAVAAARELRLDRSELQEQKLARGDLVERERLCCRRARDTGRLPRGAWRLRRRAVPGAL